MLKKIDVQPFYHTETGTITYLVINTLEKKCVIIDPVLDYEDGLVNGNSIEHLLAHIHKSYLTVDWVLDTHVHADHLTAAFYLQEKLNCKAGISANYKILQENNNNKQAIGNNYTTYFKDRDKIYVGNIPITIMSIPGHTPTCIAYLVEDYIFGGDLFLMPDIGCGRCDFEGGNASTMHDSARKILSLPASYKICVGHDYPKSEEKFRFISTVKEQKEKNPYFVETDKNRFIHKREERDSQLLPPALMNISIPYNLYKVINKLSD